jgi:hypothetical protein
MGDRHGAQCDQFHLGPVAQARSARFIGAGRCAAFRRAAGGRWPLLDGEEREGNA